MKKVFLMMVIAVLGVVSAKAQVTFGVTAGLNTSSYTGDVNGAKYKAGFQIGVLADYAITENFSIIPELQFSQKGFKYKAELGDIFSLSATQTLNYLVLPINAAYKFDVAPDSKVLVFAGPYLGYGIGSKGVEFGSGALEKKPFDIGANIGAGFQYTQFFAKLQYNLGLGNLSNVEKQSIHNSNVAFTVGYLF
jgi:hypothetical protein